MAFDNSKGSFSKDNYNSCKQAKRVLPRAQSFPRTSNSYSQLKFGMRGREADPDRIHRKKAAAVFPVSEIKDIDIEKKLNFNEGLSNNSDSLWLSSDYNSPSLPKSDDSQDFWDFDCWNVSLHDQLSSMRSLPRPSGVSLDKNSRLSMFDGSKISPIDEASLVLHRPCEDVGSKHLQEKVIIWLHNMVQHEAQDSSLGCLESGGSSNETSFFEERSIFESSCSSPSTYDGSPSFVQDFDRTNVWVSLLDLELEDSELTGNKELGFDALGPDFPSPSFSGKRNHLKPYVQTEEVMSTSEDCTADEPIFWPFDSNLYRHPELENNFLCISPRKDGTNLGIRQINKSTPIRLTLHEKKSHPVGSKKLQRCRRKLFGSAPDSTTIDSRKRVLKNIDIKKDTPPSRLSGLTPVLEQHPSVISMKQRYPISKARRLEHGGNREQFNRNLLELDSSHVQSLVAEGVPIEKLVGLNEFDGHEGVDMGIDEDQFTLHGSPYEKAFSFRDRETIVGLNKYDGRKEVDVEFAKDQSTVHGSLYKKAFSTGEIESYIGLNEFDGNEGIGRTLVIDQSILYGSPDKEALSLRETEQLGGEDL